MSTTHLMSCTIPTCLRRVTHCVFLPLYSLSPVLQCPLSFFVAYWGLSFRSFFYTLVHHTFSLSSSRFVRTYICCIRCDSCVYRSYVSLRQGLSSCSLGCRRILIVLLFLSIFHIVAQLVAFRIQPVALLLL